LRAGRLPVGVYHAWRDIEHSLHCFGLQLYDEMQEHGIKPNQSIFTVMATVFAKCGNLDRGIKVKFPTFPFLSFIV
jgi:pentatricopeptide repeat protein